MKVMIISLRSLIIGAIVVFFVLIAGIVFLLQDPLDVSSSYLPEAESVPASSDYVEPFSSEKPELALDVNVDGTTADVKLITQNFTFVDDEAESVEHGKGHAHVYLDGKLVAMTHNPEFVVKNLPEGEHELRVELTYGNHMPYKVERVQLINVK
ncbi:hypothetical protein [Brevibacillus fulvus]|uniref:DUF4399 domain-containing protein n=1 Tax=Brevibacillus fulvus TaxID=1125967 RepID=A0A938XW31_9BACL|nr:hypothetical protein [Brevibacillus fulvus]MBM7588770.1 hypothetical protein [Brevibacillus fulvus]